MPTNASWSIVGPLADVHTTIMSPEDYEALKKDAARWRYARRFIAVSEVRDWPKWAGRGHIESFEETCATERTIDATMGKD